MLVGGGGIRKHKLSNNYNTYDGNGNTEHFLGFIYLSDEVVDIYSEDQVEETDITILVNAWNKLPESIYGQGKEVANLVMAGGEEMYKEAAEKYELMVDAAKNDGVTLTICSGYRDYEEQNRKYTNAGSPDLKQKLSWYHSPLTSEHRTGLAIDFGVVSSGETGEWDTWLNTTKYVGHKEMYNWLYEHAHEYGFILRYPKGSETKTGIHPESWHYRYIGVKHAKAFKTKAKDYEKTDVVTDVKYSTYTYEEYHEEVFGTGDYTRHPGK